MRRFEGKVVVVTGAGSGIGEGTARRFSAEGATVVLVGHHKGNIAQVAKELPSERTWTRVADVSKYRQVEAAIDSTVKKFGRLDVLVNNAGIFKGSTVTKTRPEEWQDVLDTNAGGVFNGCRAGVRVNAVCPSLTLTGMTKGMVKNRKLVAKFMERMPAGRIIMPADVAAVIAFLASDDAAMVTGVNLPVDGGVTASNGQPNMG